MMDRREREFLALTVGFIGAVVGLESDSLRTGKTTYSTCWHRWLRVAREAIEGPRRCPLRNLRNNKRVTGFVAFMIWLTVHFAFDMWSPDWRKGAR